MANTTTIKVFLRMASDYQRGATPILPPVFILRNIDAEEQLFSEQLISLLPIAPALTGIVLNDESRCRTADSTQLPLTTHLYY
jgi:hypothetical protein